MLLRGLSPSNQHLNNMILMNSSKNLMKGETTLSLERADTINLILVKDQSGKDVLYRGRLPHPVSHVEVGQKV